MGRGDHDTKDHQQIANAASCALDDRALVACLRDSDTRAFAVIMGKYMNPLTRFAFSIVGSHDVADDVVQYVFVRLWERRHKLHPDSQLKPYLFHVVRNRALNEQSANSVRDRYQANAQADAIAGVLPSVVSSPEDEILTNAVVQTAIEQLSERRRMALQLRLREELTHAEIAEILEISAMAAQRLVARALADLRKIIWGV